MIKNIFIALFCLVLNLNCDSDSKDSDKKEEPPIETGINTIDYQISQDIFLNPERGFMHTKTVFSEGNELDVNELEDLKNENVSLILRLYYFDQFKNAPLSDMELDLIRNDMAHIREAGIKCVLRFAYTDDQEGTDAPLNIIETHLDQLSPILSDNADIIPFVQAGFIGAWGEWYYSSNGLTTIENKRAVLEKMLAVIPEETKIQVRTPLYKQEIFEYNSAMGSDIGYGTSSKARVGFHNDCFLASTTDYGTYQDIEAEKAFVSQEALFVPTGGETCPPVDIPLASCNTAETEMELLKWTYLNLDYYGPVLNGWRNANCFEDFQRRLGYRLALKKGEFQEEASATFTLNLNIDNLGFAPLYSKKKANLVFRAKTGGSIVKKPLQFDAREVIPNTVFELMETVDISDIPAGEYDLLLEITDTSDTLSNRPEYNIRLANNDIWESDMGYNKLGHSLTITN